MPRNAALAQVPSAGPSQMVLDALTENVRKAQDSVERAKRKLKKTGELKYIDSIIRAERKLKRARQAVGRAFGGHEFFVPLHIKD